MSLEVLDQLESKVKQAVETIQLLQLEIEELKEKNQQAEQSIEDLRSENEKLVSDHNHWQERLRSLLNKIENV